MRESIGDYRVLDRIGKSVIGDLYRARDMRAGRTVAVRILNEEVSRDPERRARFIADARAAAAVSHPNIPALYEVGQDSDLLYVVSEYVPGETLRTIIGGRPINPRRAIELAAQVADALAHAHAHGMAHGDIRPDTIVVTPRGSAKIMEPGFPAWVEAPGANGGDDRSDVVALGRVFFEMLTGRALDRPFDAQVARQGPLALPTDVTQMLERMLARGHARRFTSAAVLASELRALSATMADKAEQAAGGPSRRTWIGAILVLAALAALVWLAVFS
jgi:serine/threonine protein kinase